MGLRLLPDRNEGADSSRDSRPPMKPAADGKVDSAHLYLFIMVTCYATDVT